MQSLSRSLPVSIVIWFPLCTVRNKCECAHTMRVGMVLVVRPYIHYICDRTWEKGPLEHYFKIDLLVFNGSVDFKQ